jgi:hypothetical protein
MMTEILKRNGFIEDKFGLYHPGLDFVKLHQLIEGDGFVVTFNGSAFNYKNDIIIFYTIERIAAFYFSLTGDKSFIKFKQCTASVRKKE